MTRHRSSQSYGLGKKLKQYLLSGFIMLSFVAYTLEQNIGHAAIPTSTVAPSALVTSTSAPTHNAGLYRDGVYTGPSVDAYYGLVQVQVTIQSGMIANVQFLQYPNDRRTSVQINSIAMPYLQQEAIQVQSAHVNIISGATFTSRGFAMSLNAALQQAKN